MKIVVLGAGVIGVTTAYYLAKAGHQVEVIDRQKGPALETSFANAGEISPGYASPWAGPGIPQKAVKWLLMKHPPLIVRPVVDPYMARWLLQMLGNCTAGRYAINKSRMVRVAEYSRDVLKALRADTGISYDDRALGTLQLFRTERQLKAAQKDIEVLAEYGVPYELLDKSGCIAAEPGLAASKADIAGGLLLRNDETGDCFQFTQKLAAMAEALGVQFHYGTAITDIAVDRGKVTTVLTSQGNFTADAYVLALGSFSPIVARKLGIDLPIYPVKGYSITAPIADERTAPVSTVLDETYKIAITRLGSRIRVGGMAEISGYNSRLPQERRKTLEHCLQDLFPGSGDLAGVSFWSGLRPMTPDSTPIIGRSRLDNLLLNTGHGTLGWTMACGSGRLIADIASGVSPDIDISDLDTTRYQ